MATSKVLVVDDEQSIQKICTLYLQAEGFVVKALSAADRVVDEALSERPDVIVMDINLPGMDGFTATQALKSSRGTARIPVIILSARADVEDKRLALLECHADDYLTKPFDPEELVARVTVLCRRKRQDDKHQDGSETRMGVSHLFGYWDNQNALQTSLVAAAIEQEFALPIERISELTSKIIKRLPGSSEPKEISIEIKRLRNTLKHLSEFKQKYGSEIEPKKSGTTLDSLIKPVVSYFRSFAEKSGVNYKYVFHHQNEQIYTDKELLQKAVFLLLEEAFSRPETKLIELEAGVENKCAEINLRSASVENKPEEGAEDNSQAGGSDNILEHTCRLELTIAKLIIELLGGTIKRSVSQERETSTQVMLPMIPVSLLVDDGCH